MSRFWNWLSNLAPGTYARAASVNSQFSQINGAFGSVENEMNRTIRFTSGDVPSKEYFELGHTPAQRANLIQGFDAFGRPQLRSIALAWRGDWTTGTQFNVNDMVRAPVSSFFSIYICTVAHISSGNFETDLASGYWNLMIDMQPTSQAAAIPRLVQTNTNAAAGERLLVDVSDGPVQVTLPLDPLVGDQPIRVTHAAGNASSNPITINRNGNTIDGVAGNYLINSNGGSVQLVFAGASRGWRIDYQRV